MLPFSLCQTRHHTDNDVSNPPFCSYQQTPNRLASQCILPYVSTGRMAVYGRIKSFFLLANCHLRPSFLPLSNEQRTIKKKLCIVYDYVVVFNRLTRKAILSQQIATVLRAFASTDDVL